MKQSQPELEQALKIMDRLLREGLLPEARPGENTAQFVETIGIDRSISHMIQVMGEQEHLIGENLRYGIKMVVFLLERDLGELSADQYKVLNDAVRNCAVERLKLSRTSEGAYQGHYQEASKWMELYLGLHVARLDREEPAKLPPLPS